MRLLYLAATCAIAAFVVQPIAARAAGVDTSIIDNSIAPGDDFFGHANGLWLKSAVIPPDRSSWGAGQELVETTNKRLAELIAAAGAAHPPPGSAARQVADFYAAYMDEAGIEAKGLAPLRADLARIAVIGDKTALAGELGAELRADVDILNSTNLHTSRLFGLWVAQDLDDPAHYAPFLLQGGLGLPDRDYYLDPSPKMAAIRAAYRAHVAKVLTMGGVAGAPALAAQVVDLETAIARTHASRADSEDVTKGDNHWRRADFASRAPGLDWTAYFAAAGLGGQRAFVVWQPGALTGESALIASQPLGAWKAWLAFHLIDRAAPLLPRAFVEENFDFYARTLSGTPQLSPRWKRAVNQTSDSLGEAVGEIYVARYFPPAAKAKIESLTGNLLAAFADRIDHLSWMAPSTKAEAKAKLKALKIGVGYPDRWRDYAGLQIRPDDAFGNAERAELFDTRWNLDKLNRPVDRGEWAMTPQLVNAVNLPAMNALNFPAAILQPPFFDPAAPDAVNYGAIGATIGHEISHSFDDQGAMFDAVGRLRNWWTPADFAHFRASAAALARQFDAYRPFPDLAVRGRQTLSENIADLAGLGAAHEAFLRGQGGGQGPSRDGLTGDQQFFLAFAQSWRNKTRNAALRRQILTDGHAPARYRADTVRNLDAWYAAFGATPGQALYLAPDQRVRMW